MKVRLMKIPFFVTMIAIFLSRVYQFVFIKDSLARNNWEIIEISLFLLAIISILIMAVFSFRPKGAIFSFSFRKSTFTSTIGILSGVAIMLHGFYKLYNYINQYRDLMLLLIGVFGIASGIIFIIMSISFLKQKNLLQHKGILALIPVIWGIFRLLELFFTYYSTSNKAWAVSDEFAAIFLLLFLLNLARIFANISNHKELVKLIFYGLSSIIFIFIYTTLSIANQIVLNDIVLTQDFITSKMDLLISGFITLKMDLLIAIFIIMIINAVKLEKESDKNQIKENSIDTYETAQPKTSSTEDINMAQIDKLVDEIKTEDGIE